MAHTVDDVLDQLAIIIAELGALRAKISDSVDRSAINSQILALSKWWWKLDNENAVLTNDGINEASERLEKIAKDLKKEKKSLENVANIIRGAAQAIALAERVIKLIP